MGKSIGPFVREATGLVKTLSLKDVFMFNIFFTSFFLALVFVYEDAILEGAGANLVPGLLLSTLIIALQVMTYATLSAAMPRSGGDYVWVSRTLHSSLGFIVSWSWVVWLAFWIGFGANTLATIGLSSILATVGLATSNQALVSASQSVASQNSALLIGTIVIALFAALVIVGMRTYIKVQLAAFILGVVGTIVGFGYLALIPHQAYVTSFNKAMSQYTSNPDTYHYIITQASKNGWLPPTATISLAGMLSVLPAAFIAIPWVQGSAFIGGEIRNVKKSQILG
ncbi:MAG: amino acid permease, partial [Thermoprotei archaeon]